MNALALIAAAVAALAVSSCTMEAASAPAPTPKSRAVSDDALKEAKKLFDGRCAMCHGADGSGKGPASAGLKPQPRDFGDQAWQDSVTDEQIEMTIARGGMAVGKSALMPSSPDLAGKPIVQDLRKYIRKMRR